MSASVSEAFPLRSIVCHRTPTLKAPRAGIAMGSQPFCSGSRQSGPSIFVNIVRCSGDALDMQIGIAEREDVSAPETLHGLDKAAVDEGAV